VRSIRANGFDRRGFVAALLLGVSVTGCGSSGTAADGGGDAVAKIAAEKGIEKPNLKLGFIKLTDMAALAVAKEKGFFAEEGLNVTLEPQANWKVLLDGISGGQLDGAQMLAGHPLTIGKILKVDLPRPRDRKALLQHPDVYAYRHEVLRFLAQYDHGPSAEAA
jgi:nitrate/nitrite transport system substrate-binding protein